ncbi:MAG: DUF3618 domain-containing protein [Gemmatimonadota bacterium]
MAHRTGGFSDEPLTRYRVPDDGSDVTRPDAIQADIEATRARMSDTVEEIGDRLNPDRLRNQFKQNLHDATIGKAEHMARDAAGRVDDARHSMMDNVRDNPLPAAMVGIGLGWMFLNGRRHEEPTAYRADYQVHYGRQDGSEPNYYSPVQGQQPQERSGTDRARDRVTEIGEQASDFRERAMHRGEEIGHQAQDRINRIAHDARDDIGDFADRARSRAGQFARDTRREGHRLEDRFEAALHDSPLAIGAAAAAIGLAVGLSAPATRRESELMGSRRDQLVGRAKREVKEQARERAGEVTERFSSRAHEAVDRAAERVESEADEHLR